MGVTFWVPQAVLAVSFLTAILIFPLREDQVRLRTLFNLGGATLKLVLVGVLLVGTLRGFTFETRLPFLPDADLLLRVDRLSLLFVTLSAILWFVTTVYAIGYLEDSPHRSRFFGFFSLCVTATMGIALAGNLVTFVVFYEMLTVVTYPLVVHRGTGTALEGGRVYLLYTLIGGLLLLMGTVWLHSVAGPVEFVTGGSLGAVASGESAALRWIFLLLVAGLGVKAAIFPLHGWLPVAMVAPAPVSALLHAVAVVKAGVFGIVRVVSDVYGVDLAEGLGLLAPVTALAAITIVYGSLRALAQDDLKRLLAYSTVSQLSYITLGVTLAGPTAAAGGLVHLLHQGMMKATLFFCAGLFSETRGVHRVSEMAGMGRRMPLTMIAFTIGALGMIGLPPVAGFVTKWYLGLGALRAGETWVLGVLVASTVLNAMYFLPILGAAWFGEPPPEREADRHAEADAGVDAPVDAGAGEPRRGGATIDAEAPRLLLYPALATAALSLAAGVLAGVPFSPLWLVRLVLGDVDTS